MPLGRYNDGISRRDYALETNNNTDADDELVTNDEEEDNATMSHGRNCHNKPAEEDYFTTPVAARFGTLASTSHGSSAGPQPRTPMSPRPGPSRRQMMHSRTLSTNTILFAPQDSRQRPRRSSSASAEPVPQPRSRPLSTRHTPVESPGVPSGRRSPRRPMYLASRPRTFHGGGSRESPRGAAIAAPQSRHLLRALDIAPNPARRHSSVDIDALAAAEGADDDVPASFASQMAMERAPMAAVGKGVGVEDTGRLNKLMLSKMRTLEEGMNEIVRKMRDLRGAVVPSTAGQHDSGGDDEHGSKGRRTSGSSGGGPAVVEVARREGSRRTRTPAGRRWGGMRRGGGGAATPPPPMDKGKGKAVAVSDTEEDGDVGRLSGLDGPSSFGKGNSL